ncbi:MAG: DNA recombination protein RmuC [Bacteroidaceae bacterium]|nr:DNA recombination protein RmuC [Bacteroidaceae bacterium]
MVFVYILIGIVLGLAAAALLLTRMRTQVAVLEQEKKYLMEDVAQEKQHNQQYVEELKLQHQRQLEKAETQYKEALEQMNRQHEELLAKQMQLIKEQMNSASEHILKERAEQLSVANKEQLAGILNPLQTHIQQMREAVEKSDREHNSTMQRLDATIKTSFQLSREVGERADKLAQALTGENKTQGNFGELKLKQLLEDMGLEEGTQFELQETMKDKDGNTVYEEEGHRMIPDAILHFPDQRDVIIDSKMSFTAFEDYHNAENEEQRQSALSRHIASMRAHVNELAKKNYSKYIKDNRGRLDFVLMYVFSESALQLALSNAPTLWKEAYDKGVVISGSQNLYMMLRVLEMTWRQVRQVENQQQIMKCADELVNRVQLFAERMEDVKRQFEKTNDAFLKVEASTADSGQSIIVTARQLLKMGATENPKRKKTLKEPQSAPELPQNEPETDNF